MTTTILSYLPAGDRQGVFLAAALLSARQPELRTANRLLSALLLACVAIIGHAWLRIHQLYAAYSQSALAFKKLEVGKRANLLLMRRSPLDDIAAYDSVATVWVGGKQVARGELAARE